MNRQAIIHLGLGLCALIIALHLTGFVDLGNLVWGFVGVLAMLSISLTLAIAAEKKDQADG